MAAGEGKSGGDPAAKSKLRRIVEYDQIISQQIFDAFQPIIPRRILKTLEISGDGRIWIPIPIAVLLAARSSPLSRIATGLLGGFILDLLFVGLLKHLVRRSRPAYNKDMFLSFAVDHWSFPSGHSSRAFFISTFLYFDRRSLAGVFESEEKSEIYVRLLFLWSGATSISRVLLGRHFVVDVLVGGCLGVFLAWMVILSLEMYVYSWIPSGLN